MSSSLWADAPGLWAKLESVRTFSMISPVNQILSDMTREGNRISPGAMDAAFPDWTPPGRSDSSKKKTAICPTWFGEALRRGPLKNRGGFHDSGEDPGSSPFPDTRKKKFMLWRNAHEREFTPEP